MILLLTAFFCSLILILLIIRYKHLHAHLSSDNNLSGPQKFHQESVPRIGGLGIYTALWLTNLFAYLKDPPLGGFLSLILIATLPVVTTGLAEDLTKRIGVKTRLIAGFLSGTLLLFLFTITSIRIGIWGLDTLLMNIWVTVIFLSIACSGLANAYNIIDGFNGLASMVGIISTAAIAFVAFKVNDLAIVYAALILIGTVLGFFIWNYPKGLIFLGDGGAYLIGFFIAALSILLVHRNPMVSPWFALLVNAYPVFETLFTIWRRSIFQGKSPGLPDGAHFHSLVYRRIIRWSHCNQEDALLRKNSKTSPFLWILSCLCVFPAMIWWDNTFFLIIIFLIFIFLYVYVYGKLVAFKTPGWIGQFFNIKKR